MNSRACWRPQCCCLEATRVSLAAAQSWGGHAYHTPEPLPPGTGSSGVVPAPDAPEGALSSTSQTTVTGGRTAPFKLFYREERLRALPAGWGDKLTCLTGDTPVSITDGQGWRGS